MNNNVEAMGQRPKYPDSHQIFVGNVPQDCSETDLTNYFEQFGKVVDVRTNRKALSPGMPNFAFVAFEDDTTVQKMLGKKGGFKLPSGHRLNIEEKKARGTCGGGC